MADQRSGEESATEDNVHNTLVERGEAYGPYSEIAMVAQGVKGILHNASKWEELTSAEAESIDNIVTKLARIVVGSYQEDNWLDIEGYATLARREGRQRK